MVRYKCPKCGGGPLSGEAGGLACPACDARWETTDGVVDLAADIPYYGELPREKMKAVVQEARQKGWKKALFDNFFKENNFLYKIASYETRADWLYLLDLDPGHVVLDVGSGWGTEAVPLAKNTGHVLAMDGTMERLEFVMTRARQENAGNVSALRASILDPPLEGQQFDLAVLNGVLEWMGMADERSDPLALQKKALKNVHGLLKEGGRLYLGIENSHGFKYLLGEPDDHTGLRNITFLPRQRADALMRAVRGTDYRTYTHSRTGYEALLSEAGFSNLEFYYPMPDYKTFTYIAPLDAPGPFTYCTEVLEPDSEAGSLAQNIRNLERAALKSGTLGEYASSYGIIAEKV